MNKEYKRVISIGGHPLDAEIMGGAMLLKQNSKGAKTSLVHVTTGRLEDKNATEEQKKEYLDLLNKQIQEAAMALNSDVVCLNYLSSNMPTMPQFIDVIYEYLKKEDADLVVTHHMGTLHDRHFFTYKGVLEAVRRLRKEGKDIDLLYGENLEDLVGFVPTKYQLLNDDEKKQWFNALNKYDLYRGGVNIVPYDDYYRTMGRVRALEAMTPGFVKAYMHAGLVDY